MHLTTGNIYNNGKYIDTALKPDFLSGCKHNPVDQICSVNLSNVTCQIK